MVLEDVELILVTSLDDSRPVLPIQGEDLLAAYLPISIDSLVHLANHEILNIIAIIKYTYDFSL